MTAAPPSAVPLPDAAAVVAYWRDAGPARWFRKDDAFDADFRARFLPAHEAAARGELDGWAGKDAGTVARRAQGALALLILLDQFPRNAFRGTARMFATDAQARRLAAQAVAAGLDQQADAALRRFFYLPFTHSEQLADQDRAVALTEALDADTHRFARHHRDIIARFGRFPHRNAVLGRATTSEEQRFLDEGGFSG
ncbi:DUF924 family protein [Variovorax terrae]|uniref:DUF924 family protein n=1 Tax=Variovorax terrae TaxID=2923278 RepID=A0A9X2AML6_9BURK|nr:DUF924 family protein [Variovorax terrae]MCJ0763489.1 DUF924 family protein [Variovorax terrae]